MAKQTIPRSEIRYDVKEMVGATIIAYNFTSMGFLQARVIYSAR